MSSKTGVITHNAQILLKRVFYKLARIPSVQDKLFVLVCLYRNDWMLAKHIERTIPKRSINRQVIKDVCEEFVTDGFVISRSAKELYKDRSITVVDSFGKSTSNAYKITPAGIEKAKHVESFLTK